MALTAIFFQAILLRDPVGDRGEVGVVVIILLLLLCCHTPAVFPLLHVGAHLARCPRAPGRAPLCCRALWVLLVWGLESLEADIKSLPKIKYLMHQLSSAQLGILHVCTIVDKKCPPQPGLTLRCYVTCAECEDEYQRSRVYSSM